MLYFLDNTDYYLDMLIYLDHHPDDFLPGPDGLGIPLVFLEGGSGFYSTFGPGGC